ncbi:hypothetical protein GCM10007963_16860 [Lutibacter litoralis]|nr:hypothetical protein GCM10007963_16860 [Lutibacter litoralis]
MVLNYNLNIILSFLKFKYFKFAYETIIEKRPYLKVTKINSYTKHEYFKFSIKSICWR